MKSIKEDISGETRINQRPDEDMVLTPRRKNAGARGTHLKKAGHLGRRT